MRIIIADDHQIFIDGMRTLLELVPEYKIVAEVGDNFSLMESVIKHNPDLIFQDYRMPGGTISTLNEIKERFPKIKVILLTGVSEGRLYHQFYQSKADGVLLKDISAEDLLKAIADVIAGDRVLSPAVKECLQSQDKIITTREFQILELIAEGFTTNDISFKLSRSSKTIENHRYSLMQKLEAKNIAELLKVVYEKGILEY